MKNCINSEIRTNIGTLFCKEINKDAGGCLVVLVSGGPCGSYEFLEKNFAKYFPNMYFVAYSQMNSYRSNPISREDSSYWNIDYYTDELDTILKHIGTESCILAGYSYGAALAVNYAAAHKDKVRGMVLLSPLVDTMTWMESADMRLACIAQNEDFLMERLAAAYPAGYDTKKAADYIMETLFTVRYLCNKINPDVLMDRLRTGKIKPLEGSEVYRYMWGENEFECTGVLRNLDLRKKLKEVGRSIPVVIAAGKEDVLTPDAVYGYAKLCRAECILVDGGTHMWLLDAPSDELMKAIHLLGTFLNEHNKTNDHQILSFLSFLR